MKQKFVNSVLLIFFCNALSFGQIIDWKSTYGSASDCQIDLNCNSFSLSNEIKENLARSVVMFEINTGETTGPNFQTQTCSATILAKENNGNPTPDYYILTARHCLHKDKECAVLSPGGCIPNNGLAELYNLNKVRIHFNQSIPNCGETKPSFLNHYVETSVTLVEESLTNDLALLKINTPIPPHFKPYYAGWSASFFNTNTFC